VPVPSDFVCFMTMASLVNVDTASGTSTGQKTSFSMTDKEKHDDDDDFDNDDDYNVENLASDGLLSNVSDRDVSNTVNSRRRQQQQQSHQRAGRHSHSGSLIGMFHNDNNNPLSNTSISSQKQQQQESEQWSHHHMKTYTAGEDNGRLAQAAKELGLANSRQPRKQVRKRQQIYWDGEEIMSFTGNPRQFFHQHGIKKKKQYDPTTPITKRNPIASMWQLVSSVVEEGRTEGAQMLALYSAHSFGGGVNNEPQNKAKEKDDDEKSQFQRNVTIPSPFLYNIRNSVNDGGSNRKNQHIDLLRLHRKNENDDDDDNYLVSDYNGNRRYDQSRSNKVNRTAESLFDRSHCRQRSAVAVVEIEKKEIDGYNNNDDDNTFIDNIGDSSGGHDEIDGNGDLTSAMLATIRGMVGPAILYLPYGFANAGYVIALPLLATCTFFFLYSSDCLLDAWKYEHDKAYQNGSSSNTEDADVGNASCEQSPLLVTNSTTSLPTATASPNAVPRQLVPLNQQQQQVLNNSESAMLSYPELAYRALGTVGETCVKVGIASMQAGVCLTYLIFVPKNLHSSILYVFKTNIPPLFLLIGMIFVQIPLSWIRDIRKLTPTNLLANILILYGLLVCLGYAIVRCCTTTAIDTLVHTDTSNGNVIGNIWSHIYNLPPYQPNWILFIGTSVFLFEGSITLLIPLQESVVVDIDDDNESPVTDEERKEMRQPELLFPIVYRRVILCIISFYTVFGLTCWMAYGDSVNVVMTTSLPESGLATSVQLAYSIAVMFTFPLQNFPALEIITRSIMTQISQWKNTISKSGQRHESNTQKRRMYQQIQRNIISSCTVFVLALIAVFTMDSLDKVVSLLGSLLGCPIAYILPPLIHTKLVLNKCKGYETEQAEYRKRLYLNYVAIAFGLVAMIMASIITILDWK
jgi:solute carrier family 36 (proton-coupled amino acid transporter)